MDGKFDFLELNDFIKKRYSDNKEELNKLDGKLTEILQRAGVKLDGAESSKTYTPDKAESEIITAMQKAFNNHFKNNETFKNTKVEKDKNGHELVVSKDNKELFRATSTSVNTKDVSDESLKAMSAAIVANLKERLLQGGDPAKLKISLGDCHPEGVEDKFAGFINE